METIRTFLKPVIDLQGTGAQIRRLRKLNGFSVHELQQIFGFEYPQAIYAWEAGKNAPTIDNLLVLAQLFKVDVSEIVASVTVEVSIPFFEHMDINEFQDCKCKSSCNEARLNSCKTGKSCRNSRDSYCEQCRFRKLA